jgi:hypothetical protein
MTECRNILYCHIQKKSLILISISKVLQEKAVEATKQKEDKRKKPKPEEQEGMPHRQQCPHAKRLADRNPEYHEEQQIDVA